MSAPIKYYIIYAEEKSPRIDGPYIQCAVENESSVVLESNVFYFSLSGNLYYKHDNIVYSTPIRVRKIPDYIECFDCLVQAHNPEHLTFNEPNAKNKMDVYSDRPFFMTHDTVDEYLNNPIVMAYIMNHINCDNIYQDVYAIFRDNDYFEFHYHDITRKLDVPSFNYVMGCWNRHGNFDLFLRNHERDPDTEFLQM